MQAIEFETTIQQQQIHIPEHLTDGTPVRVLLLLDNQHTSNQDVNEKDWKSLLSAMPNVGEDEDFLRPLDQGRDESWDIC
ncbi:MAG: hypothetical protein PHH59_04235 [Methylovulum sp.]|uniref:hypothetical protein n=1 Tax=Methylovulum sp. TaxID=1916980 RepID=UPI00262A07F5|nr:hypothetical protein [Methylovulum sp.]MDD2723218.1 hypothetical protein [Methylovulum sp.]MDD5123159.1 hypothetical protein [Methylovulum sp.]